MGTICLRLRGKESCSAVTKCRSGNGFLLNIVIAMTSRAFRLHASLLRLRCNLPKIFASSGALPRKGHDACFFRSFIEATVALEWAVAEPLEIPGVLLASE